MDFSEMPPAIQIRADLPPTLVGFFLMYVVVEFLFLYRILTRSDYDTFNKLLWVVVVIGAPVIGCVLYLITAPSSSVAVPPARHGDDVSGTPWANDPGYTRPS